MTLNTGQSSGGRLVYLWRTAVEWLTWSGYGALIGLTLVMAAALALLLLAGNFYAEKVLIGVRVGEVALGGLTPQEAERRLRAEWEPPATVTVRRDDGAEWTLAPEELGLTLDAAATAAQAAAWGRGDEERWWAWTVVQTALKGADAPPAAALERAAAWAGLQALAESVAVPVQEADIEIIGDRVQAIPGRPGAQLDLAATVDELAAHAAETLAGEPLALQMQIVEPRLRDASAVAREAQNLLRASFAVHAYDPIGDETITWVIAPAELGRLLGVQVVNAPDGSAQAALGVDREQVRAYLERAEATLEAGLALEVDESVELFNQALLEGHNEVTLILRHPPTTYEVQLGDSLAGIARQFGIPLWRMMQANPALVGQTLHGGESVNIPSRDELLPLPIVLGKRIVISLSRQRMQVYENGAVIYDWVVSTGIAESPTWPGVFQVQTHEENAYASNWDLWMPHFLGIYEATPNFMNGIHGLPTLSGGGLMWASALGTPASYGCIILSLENAAALYDWAEDGVLVEIRP